MKTLGIVLIIIGLIMLVMGALFTFVTFGFGIFCVWPLLLIGLILLILGIVLVAMRESRPSQPVIIQQTPQAQQPQQRSEKDRYCPSCGRSIPFDAINCPYCDKKFS